MLPDRHRLPRDRALALLARAPVIHVAAADEGTPLLRPLHAVLLDDALVWHGSQAGEKSRLLGRPLAVMAHERVAEIPSHFIDPERACPATTYYESVHATGRAEDVLEPVAKARALQALMEKYQPEGGHRRLEGEDPFYAASLAGTRVIRMPLATITGKSKLGQNRSPEQRLKILERLWARGGPGDLAALDRIRAANPGTPLPDILTAPAACSLRCAPEPALAPAAAALLAGQSWTRGESLEALGGVHRRSEAWLAIQAEPGGELLATGRVLGDGLRVAWILDLVVREDRRGRGLGSALLRLLMDHPQARGARQLCLRPQEAAKFFTRFGFEAPPPEGDSSPLLCRSAGR